VPLVEISQPALLCKKDPSEGWVANIVNVSQAAGPARNGPEHGFTRIAKIFGQLAVSQAGEPIVPDRRAVEDAFQP
jgi:hypothetical protein